MACLPAVGLWRRQLVGLRRGPQLQQVAQVQELAPTLAPTESLLGPAGPLQGWEAPWA